MISFRFQVVALTAVFGAVAGGLLLGTAAAGRSASDAAMREQAAMTAQDNQQLRERLEHLGDDVAARERFAEQLAPVVLAGRLASAKVLILATDAGQDNVEPVARMLGLAGATVTGRIVLRDQFLDPGQTDALLDLATTALPPTVAGGLPVSADGVSASAALLAAVLLNPSAAVTPADQHAVLVAYASRNYLTGADSVTAPSDVVVLMTGPPDTGPAAGLRNAALLSVVDRFDQAGHVVVAAPTDTGSGNVVAQLRAGAHRSTVSTVDNVGTPQGRLVTAWAVAEQLAGRSGHFGVGAGAQLVPAVP
jgi:hypothetical protein